MLGPATCHSNSKLVYNAITHRAFGICKKLLFNMELTIDSIVGDCSPVFIEKNASSKQAVLNINENTESQ